MFGIGICKAKAASILIGAMACVAVTGQGAAQDRKQQTTGNGTVRVEMRNVLYHFLDQVSVHILRLEGMLVPQNGSSLPIFDDPHSFSLAIHSAEMSMRTDSLSHVLNQYVFAAPDAPIKDVLVTTQVC
jgi:hypothetical protein